MGGEIPPGGAPAVPQLAGLGIAESSGPLNAKLCLGAQTVDFAFA